MQSSATTPQEYLASLPEQRKEAMAKLRQVINDNLPAGFEEIMIYGMLGWVVPHSIYPDGYHCDPKLPLSFINIASQKNFIALYHFGIYADPNLMEWFVAEYPNYVKTKLDMGKGCVRFKKPETIPYELIGQVVSKITVQQWITLYETKVKR